jgi:hypothetical protein
MNEFQIGTSDLYYIPYKRYKEKKNRMMLYITLNSEKRERKRNE